jgi:hypothetical protein
MPTVFPARRNSEGGRDPALWPARDSHPARDAPSAAGNRYRANVGEEWWQSVLADPRAAGKPWVRIEQRRSSEVPREVLRSAPSSYKGAGVRVLDQSMRGE